MSLYILLYSRSGHLRQVLDAVSCDENVVLDTDASEATEPLEDVLDDELGLVRVGQRLVQQLRYGTS